MACHTPPLKKAKKQTGHPYILFVFRRKVFASCLWAF